MAAGLRQQARVYFLREQFACRCARVLLIGFGACHGNHLVRAASRLNRTLPTAVSPSTSFVEAPTSSPELSRPFIFARPGADWPERARVSLKRPPRTETSSARGPRRRPN